MWSNFSEIKFKMTTFLVKKLLNFDQIIHSQRFKKFMYEAHEENNTYVIGKVWNSKVRRVIYVVKFWTVVDYVN